jgi:predicted dehydrogenase
MTRPLRAGIFGPGGVAARHAAAINAHPGDMELVACCGRDSARTAAFAARFGGASYVELQRMLDQAAPDLLVIASPPFAHLEPFEQAARRGIHVLIEKPIALNDDDAERMIEAARTASIITQVGFMYRFGAAVERFCALQAARETGPIGLFAAHFHCNALHAPWWRERRKSGGQIVEQMIHLVDLARCVLGEPRSVYARAANLFHGDVSRYDSEDVSAIVLGYESEAIATLNATNAAVPGKWDKAWRIVSERMTAHFTDWNHATLTWTGGEPREEQVESETDVFAAQLLDFIGAIREKRPARISIEEGARSLKLALAARRSAEERREILL